MDSFARPAIKKYRQLVGLKERNASSQSPGSYKSKIEGSSGPPRSAAGPFPLLPCSPPHPSFPCSRRFAFDLRSLRHVEPSLHPLPAASSLHLSAHT